MCLRLDAKDGSSQLVYSEWDELAKTLWPVDLSLGYQVIHRVSTLLWGVRSRYYGQIKSCVCYGLTYVRQQSIVWIEQCELLRIIKDDFQALIYGTCDIYICELRPCMDFNTDNRPKHFINIMETEHSP